MFKKGNLVRLDTEDEDTPILQVAVDTSDDDRGTTYTLKGSDSEDWAPNLTDDLELVAENLQESGKTKNPQPMEEQTVAISYDGIPT